MEHYMPLTKAQIISNLLSIPFFTKIEATRAVETALEIIKQTLQNGEDILISGFGKFSVRDKRPRRGRNPQTTEDLLIDDRRVITFRCSGVLRDKIKGS
jgi:integration host factor subunit alpha